MTTPTLMYPPTDTPWGTVEDWECSDLGGGIWLVHVPGTGGIHISGPAADTLPYDLQKRLINGPEWAESDTELPIVVSIVLHLLDPNLLRIHLPQALPNTDNATPAIVIQAHRVCQNSRYYAEFRQHLPSIQHQLIT